MRSLKSGWRRSSGHLCLGADGVDRGDGRQLAASLLFFVPIAFIPRVVYSYFAAVTVAAIRCGIEPRRVSSFLGPTPSSDFVLLFLSLDVLTSGAASFSFSTILFIFSLVFIVIYFTHESHPSRGVARRAES